MKTFLIILSVTFSALSAHSMEATFDPNSDKSVVIYPEIQTNMLSIEVDEALSGSSITVSIFSGLGEVVLETELGLGLNKINVADLKQGEYVAVVRENGVYTSKSSFEVK